MRSPPEHEIPPTHLVPKGSELDALSSLPADYTPFAGGTAECIDNFPARNQGSCGSCYAFAASTMLSLRYCLAVHKEGYSRSTAAVPTLTAQGMVSCGTQRKSTDYGLLPYTSGCRGASPVLTMEYLQDFGISSTACSPYASGGGGGGSIDATRGARTLLLLCWAVGPSAICGGASQSSHRVPMGAARP